MKYNNEKIKQYLDLVQWHRERCLPYNDIISELFKLDFQNQYDLKLENLPYIPVSLFKELELASIQKSNIYKIMRSSGTSGQKQSKIFLDRENANSQIKALSTLTQALIGKKRLPMIIFDSESTVRNRSNFSARTAGIIGYSVFGKDITYAFDENMKIDAQKINKFFCKHAGHPTLAYGFTYIIWPMIQELPQDLKEILKNCNTNCTLIHGGGWKKLWSRKYLGTNLIKLSQII